MKFEKPTKAAAILQLISAIKMCRASFGEDYINFADMLKSWERRAVDMRHTVIHKDGGIK